MRTAAIHLGGNESKRLANSDTVMKILFGEYAFQAHVRRLNPSAR
jgi:hypothetical protein